MDQGADSRERVLLEVGHSGGGNKPGTNTWWVQDPPEPDQGSRSGYLGRDQLRLIQAPVTSASPSVPAMLPPAP